MQTVIQHPGMPTPDSIQTWPHSLESALDALAHFDRAIVLAETASTQDIARQHPIGTVVTTARQTRGRGRRGNAWTDIDDHGIAMSLVVRGDQPGNLAICTAVAVASALTDVVISPVKIKWPNDIWIDQRKAAGILIERFDDKAIIGVGVNVHQTQWPSDLAATAISLAQAGYRGDRISIIEAVLRSVDAHFGLDTDAIAAAFTARDALKGRTVTVNTGGQTVRGRVIAIDPANHLILDAGGESRTLDAATTTIQSIDD